MVAPGQCFNFRKHLHRSDPTKSLLNDFCQKKTSPKEKDS
jgi:hypothetical protein